MGAFALSGGRLMLNDDVALRVLLFDSTLRTVSPIIDTMSTAARRYDSQRDRIVRCYGDTTLFVDAVASAIVVVDPQGRAIRVVASPSPLLISGVANYPLGPPGCDAQGRLIFRVLPSRPNLGRPPVAADFEGKSDPESMFVARADLRTRLVDTIATLNIGRPNLLSTEAIDGRKRTVAGVRPLEPADDWTVCPDGWVAILRAHDYHIDWIRADGTRSSTKPIQHAWKRLGDADKKRVIDSVAAVLDSLNAAGTNSSRYVTLDPSLLPDYATPFAAHESRCDLQGNVWARTTPNGFARGPVTYDVINRDGTLIDRVQIPGGTSLLAVGSGVVYLSSREANGIVIARAPIR